jgi:dihydroxy-acid dehydratase
MNFNTLSGSAKLYKKLGTYATGQTVTSGEVPNIAILVAVNMFEHKRLVESVGFGVRAHGGVVTVYNVPAFGFFNKTNPMTAKYADSFRRTAAATAEAVVKTNLADGAVIIADCDITAAGLLMGCARANCPAIILPTGIYLGDMYPAAAAKVDTDALRTMGAIAGGKINAKQGEEVIKNAFAARGISNRLNSVSTFFTLAEGMGFALEGAALNTIDGGAHMRCAVATGEQICANAKDLLMPKKFLTRAALQNITALCLAIGGNISALSLFTGLVQLFDPKIPHELIAEMSAKTPLLLAHEAQTTAALAAAGGVNAVMKWLSLTPRLIDEGALTLRGERLKNVLPNLDAARAEPAAKTARIILARGTACEDGGYIQPAKQTPATFSGKAWVYQSIEEADKALLSGNIPGGSVIVVQNSADTYVTALAYAIEGMNKQDEIAVLTDGLSEKTDALVVTRCKPTSLENQAFANIQNGDTIEIDLTRARINTSVLSKEQKIRQKKNAVKKQAVYFC